MPTVEAPNRAYNGSGPGGAVFVDGVAEVIDEAALNYYRGAGYRVDDQLETEPTAAAAPDPRDISTEQLGSTLRDAAVDPAPGDFLAPTNAGKANPHGTDVVSPQIHASGPAGIVPGTVPLANADQQEQAETQFAQARLVDGTSAAEAVAQVVPDPDARGDLGLSDPGSATGTNDGRPAGNASLDAWQAYATTQGATEEWLDGKTRNEIRDAYPAPAEA